MPMIGLGSDKKRGGPICTIADMFLARIWGVFLIHYISKGIVEIENITIIVHSVYGIILKSFTMYLELPTVLH